MSPDPEHDFDPKKGYKQGETTVVSTTNFFQDNLIIKLDKIGDALIDMNEQLSTIGTKLSELVTKKDTDGR